MQSFYQRFLASAQRLPDHVSVELQKASPSTEIEAYTFAELRTRAEAVAQWLQASGGKPGDRCAILGLNGPRWVMAYLGILAAGGVAVPLDTAFKPAQVAKLLEDCGSSLLFCDEAHFEIAREALASRPQTKLALLQSSTGQDLPSLDRMFTAATGNFTPHPSTADDVAVILYTSGTTSDPKGVMLTHANLDAEAKAIFNFIRVDETDAILGVLPLFHALAQMANLLVPFSSGCRVVYMEQLNTGELLRALRDGRITLFCCVPQFFYLIHEKVMKQVAESSGLKQTAFRILMRLSRAGRYVGVNLGKIFFSKAHQTLGTHMRYLITGGSRFDTKIGQDLETLGFDILQAYGLTECCGGATVTAQKERFVGAVGRPLPSVEVKVIESGLQDSDEGGVKAGEVLIRGPIVMKGYYNRPDATAEMLQDGWLHTGDLGHIGDSGNLFITGRKKDVIVLSSGKNVYPEEIEAHYLASPWIKEICAMGLRSRPGEPFAERIHAVVVPNM
ncbi:MAG: AMP-binding protein [Terriglobales bacterium]